MAKARAKLLPVKPAGTAADDIKALRDAVVIESDLLLSDLCLPELGLPERSVRSRLHDRGVRWDRNTPAGSKLAELKAILHNKSTGRRYAVAQGCRVPELYWFGKATEPPDFSRFPPNFVLKPDQSHSTQGVVVCRDGVDLIAQKKVLLSDLPELMTRIAPSIGLTADAKWLVEELVLDANPQYGIPLDFKLFCAGGRAHLLFCSDRNGKHSHWSASWYTRSWQRINERMNYGFMLGPTLAKPMGFEALLEIGDHLARALSIFLRIDCYMSPKGPVFGEFSPFPSHGLKNTEIGERALSQLWSLFPDPEGL